MAASSAQIRVHRFLSGWCEATLHHRCRGNYDGIACCCPCHQLAAAGPAQDMT